MHRANRKFYAVTLAVWWLCSLLAAAEDGGPVTFELDIQPLLTRYGCNAGACHGKSRGQNGFALSLLGFDADYDHASLTLGARGRRLVAAAPAQSLLLLKATGQVPHGGGVRFDAGSPPYELLRSWVGSGAPRTPADAPALQRVRVEPSHSRMAPGSELALRVFAEYSDGGLRDVTDASAFQSNEQAIVAVGADGMMRAGPVPGEAAIMARYMNHISVCAITIPLPESVSDEIYEQLPQKNRIDGFVWQKLKLLSMLPSAPANDTTFHRRAWLRIVGRLPVPDETREFLDDARPDKRDRLIDELLERPEYADFWANKWADLLRPNPYRAGIKAVRSLDAWLRDAFRQNMPYDQFVRHLLTAQGSTWRNGATVLFRDRPDTVEIGASVSQLFLGVRLECAKCHHHPFEVWSQDDFYGFSAFFARVGRKGSGLSPPISGGEEMIFTSASGQLNHGRTGSPVVPTPLAADPVDISAAGDPRTVLVDWMTGPTNPYFAKVMANRVWAELMGQGLVEPVDDLRATNPASNEKLLEFLAEEFRRHDYDIKQLIRTITRSYVFGLSSLPGESNGADLKNFSRYYRQRMRAEILHDVINDVLDAETPFAAMPSGSRAMQLWTYRSDNVLLDTFGRPDPNQDPPCERSFDGTTPQVLHLMNSPEIERKLGLDTSRPAQLAASGQSNEDIVKESYLWLLCRLPGNDEMSAVMSSPAWGASRRQAVEDLFWALLNTPEFLYID